MTARILFVIVLVAFAAGLGIETRATLEAIVDGETPDAETIIEVGVCWLVVITLGIAAIVRSIHNRVKSTEEETDTEE